MMNIASIVCLALLGLVALPGLAGAITLGEVLNEVIAKGSCGPTRRALTVGTQSYRRILNTVRDWDLGAEGFDNTEEFYRVFMIPGSSGIVDDWVSGNIRNGAKSQAWTTDSLVEAATNKADEEHDAAIYLARQLVGNTLFFYSRNGSVAEGYTAPDWDGEQLFVVFQPVLHEVLAGTGTANQRFTVFFGDTQNPTSEILFEQSPPLFCKSGNNSTIILRPAELEVDVVVMSEHKPISRGQEGSPEETTEKNLRRSRMI